MEFFGFELVPTSNFLKLQTQTATKVLSVKEETNYFYCGDQYMNVLHTRLRNECSSLNGDLFRCNLVPDPSCLCGYRNESVGHYLFDCYRYTLHRNTLFGELTLLDL